MTPVSFASDIMPIFDTFKAQMMWRFDVTSYDQVKANAALIYARISSSDGPMPPPPFPPLTPQQIDLFNQWMQQGCLP